VTFHNIKKYSSIFCIFIFISIFFANPTFSSMDPLEIKKRNSEAPFHVIGKVTSDELFKDLTKEEGAPYQLRKMTIELEEVLKKPSSTNVDVLAIDIYYSYIPSWRALDYVGGHQPMDITVNDVIEIWLREGEYGWEPVLSGDSVKYINYVEERNEPIPEPLLHSFIRIIKSGTQYNGNGIVITGIFLSIIVLFYIGLKKKN